MASDLALYEGQHRQSYMRNAFLNRQLWKSKLQQGESLCPDNCTCSSQMAGPKQNSRVPCAHEPGRLPSKLDSLELTRHCKKACNIKRASSPEDTRKMGDPAGKVLYQCLCPSDEGCNPGSRLKCECSVNRETAMCGKYVVAEDYDCVCPPHAGPEVQAGVCMCLGSNEPKFPEYRRDQTPFKCHFRMKEHQKRHGGMPQRTHHHHHHEHRRSHGVSCQCEPHGPSPYRPYETLHSKCPANMNRIERRRVPSNSEFECSCFPGDAQRQEHGNMRFVPYRESQPTTDTRIVPTPCTDPCARKPCYVKKVPISLPYMSCRCAAHAQGRYRDPEEVEWPLVTTLATEEIRPTTTAELIRKGSYCGVQFRHIDDLRPTPRTIAARKHGICPGHDPRYGRRETPVQYQYQPRQQLQGLTASSPAVAILQAPLRDSWQSTFAEETYGREPLYQPSSPGRRSLSIQDVQARHAYHVPAGRKSNELRPLHRTISRTLQFVEHQPANRMEYAEKRKERPIRRSSKTLVFPFDREPPETKPYKPPPKRFTRSLSMNDLTARSHNLPYVKEPRERNVTRTSKTLIFPFEAPYVPERTNSVDWTPQPVDPYYARLSDSNPDFQYPVSFEVPQESIQKYQNTAFFSRW